MSLKHFAILAVWTVVVLFVTGALSFFFTYGDCFDNQSCSRLTNQNFALIAGIAFVLYWAVFIALIRRWNR